MKIALTEKQRAILNEIKRIKASGREPTFAELAEKFKQTVPSIYHHVLAMQAKGYVDLEYIEVGTTGKAGGRRITVLEPSYASDMVKRYIESNRRK